MSNFFRPLAAKLGFSGSSAFEETYLSWSEVQSSVSGYSDPTILNQVREALGRVRDGVAEYERDGINFPEIQYSWPVLSGLLLAAAQNNGVLRVVDFGGSLGTTYFQNRKYLERLNHVEWRVVEQSNFASTGTVEFANEQLSFDTDLKRSLNEVKPSVVLFSSSLQYVEDPDSTLNEALISTAHHIIIDRTPFHKGDSHILTIQTVPPSIYRAKYAAWVLSHTKFLGHLPRNWEPVLSFESLGGLATTKQETQFSWEGLLLSKA